jgi:Rod binding domain-containing protein
MSTIPNTPSFRPNTPTPLNPFNKNKPPHKDTGPLTDPNANSLAKAIKPTNESETVSAASQAREAAEGLVSTTFIEPILKQLRESNNTPPPFGPSNAEKQFSALLDTKLSDEIVKAANFPLVERIIENILRNAPSDEQASPLPRANRPQTPSLDIKG